jgi:hypothetical protein
VAFGQHVDFTGFPVDLFSAAAPLPFEGADNSGRKIEAAL